LRPAACRQLDAFAAGIQFARAEGIIPAPEANHAVAGAIQEALKCKEEGTERTILFNLCGHGHFDMQSYINYQAGCWRITTTRQRRLPWRWRACRRWGKGGDRGFRWARDLWRADAFCPAGFAGGQRLID